MDSCDVLIVGGGPAGSSCAWGLRSSGLHVVIADRANFPRDKVCGGWITPLVVRELELDLRDYAAPRDGRVLQPITGFRVSRMGVGETEVPWGGVASYGIRRRQFDHYLLERSGARLLQGYSVKSLERKADGWLMNGSFYAKMVVGAGGHFCPIARLLGEEGKSGQPVIAQETEFEMDPQQAGACAIQPEIPELYFCGDLKGYAWCFRKKDVLNIGLGRLDGQHFPARMAGFLAHLRKSRKVEFEIGSHFGGHAYFLFGDSRRRMVNDGVLLIGDAAGLAYPQSGEGIRTAVESGLLAAEVIAAAAGNYACSRLAPYARAVHARLAAANKGSASFLPAALRPPLARILLRSRRFCRDVVLRDWFLHADDPPLQATIESALQAPVTISV